MLATLIIRRAWFYAVLGGWPSVTDGQDHRVENKVELDLMVTSLSQVPARM